jgi:hypothetical protein
MNERIQDLIKQSGGHWNRDLTMDHHGNFITSHSVKFQKDDIEKFAELIVGECVRVLEGKKLADTPMGVEAFVEDWDVGYNDAMEDAVKCIQQHFGVE